jgi:hypothetical protein
LRLESPVYELPNGAYHLISRYEDVVKAAQDTESRTSAAQRNRTGSRRSS